MNAAADTEPATLRHWALEISPQRGGKLDFGTFLFFIE